MNQFPKSRAEDDGATIAGVSVAGSSIGSSASGIGGTAPGLAHLGPSLQPGTVLSGRYEIVQLLGEGGMGAVYKSHDRALDRTVALKTIRPELARHASMLARFKQEVLVASQITHRNVVRLYDLGESDGLMFITMEFVEGDDLRTILEQKGKCTAKEAVSIMRQVCFALDAAHAQGVIHRDLKPQNIMREHRGASVNGSSAMGGADGRIVVMDFGLARTLTDSGMTQTGALVGTMEYMSPEQALGQDVDVRSDLFAAGLIFYELLTGHVPYKADSAVASLLKRTTERAKPASDVDASIPLVLSNIVSKCLERDRTCRYQSAQELLNDLESWKEGHDPVAITRQARRQVLPRRRLYAMIAVLLLAVVGAGGIALQRKPASGEEQKQVAGPTLSLAILPFRNASVEPRMDWLSTSLPEMLRSDIGHSPQLRTVPSARLEQMLADLHISSRSSLQPSDVRRLAEFANANIVVAGQYTIAGERILLDATFHDLKTDRVLPLKAEATSEKELVGAVGQLAKTIRENLALSPDDLRELQAKAFKPSSESVEALRSFNEGLKLAHDGRSLQAVKSFEAATKADPQFATAYAHLGKAYSVLGYENNAELAVRKAVSLAEGLPEPERFRIAAIHAIVTREYSKAIGSHEQLANALPDDTSVLYTLGTLHEQTGAFDKAGEYYSHILKIDPNSTDALLGSGRVSLLSGDTKGSLENLNRALTRAMQDENDEQRASALQAIGVAYRSMNKPQDALRYFHESLEVKRRLSDQRGIASSLHATAQVQNDLGKSAEALKNFQASLRIQREIGNTRGVGDTLLDLGVLYNDTGRYDDALNAFRESLQIERAVGNQNYEAINLNNIGTSYFFKGQYEDARTYYEQALQLREKLKIPGDIADTLHNLAETSTNIGDFEKAQKYYLRALDIRRASGDRRGAAIDSYSMGKVFEQQGRYGAATAAMADSLTNLRSLGNRDYWLAEVMSGYGGTLALVGRTQEATNILQEAMALSRESNNQALIAQTMIYQADAAFYSGSFDVARKTYEQAIPLARQAKDNRLVLMSRLGAAKVAVRQSRASSVLGGLSSLCEKADTAGLKYLAVDCSTYLGEALLQRKDYTRARQTLEASVMRSDRLGLKPVLARAHLLMSRLLAASGNQRDSENHQAQAQRILDEIRQEGAATVVKRSDLAPLIGN
ncbi:MAG TPA: tetratricopeptide repeat protein [Terriglobales bacterium]|nr:tetratricopeptide repeat protein [Terriglobales bacterium]